MAGVLHDAGKRPRFFWSARRTPIHPGHFLETRYLRPGGIFQERLAQVLGISRRRVNELACGERAITPDTAVRRHIISIPMWRSGYNCNLPGMCIRHGGCITRKIRTTSF